MSLNPFEQYEDAAKPIWRQRQERSTAKRKETLAQKKSALELKRDEDAILSKQARAEDRKAEDALFEGPHGKDARGLKTFLRTMTLSSAPALIKLIERAAWVRSLSFEQRYVVTRMVSKAIISLRKREGLPPFDDYIPFGDEAPTAFHQIKALIDAPPSSRVSV